MIDANENCVTTTIIETIRCNSVIVRNAITAFVVKSSDIVGNHRQRIKLLKVTSHLDRILDSLHTFCVSFDFREKNGVFFRSHYLKSSNYFRRKLCD